MADEVGIALLGAGFAGRVHALAARMLGARLVGVAASTPARSRRRGRGIWRRVTPSPMPPRLVAHPEVEVVHVCTPNALHVPHVQLALDHGKHVICEKPLATSAADTARLSSVAREAGLIAAVCFAYRYQSVACEPRAKICSERRTGFHPAGARRLSARLAALPGRHRLAGRLRNGRAVARLCRYRLALV